MKYDSKNLMIRYHVKYYALNMVLLWFYSRIILTITCSTTDKELSFN